MNRILAATDSSVRNLRRAAARASRRGAHLAWVKGPPAGRMRETMWGKT